MAHGTLVTDLATLGPAAALRQPTLAEASDYCRRLARRHYENFTVASWLLPRPLRRHFCHVYAYCRWADDLADEPADAARRRELLQWWQAELDDCYRGQARHPVFVALGETIAEFAIPRQPLADLLVAFRQDQDVARYESFDELLQYCRNSANPVGRLVLYLGRCHDERRGALADAICTGLQLANFWQDVAQDWDRGRVYLPQATLRKHGCGPEDFAARRATGAFRAALAEEVDRAEEFLRRGEPLVKLVPRELAIDVDLFVRGGLAVLAAIRRQAHDVWARRPAVSKGAKLGLVCGAWWRARRRPSTSEPRGAA